MVLVGFTFVLDSVPTSSRTIVIRKIRRNNGAMSGNMVREDFDSRSSLRKSHEATVRLLLGLAIGLEFGIPNSCRGLGFCIE